MWSIILKDVFLCLLTPCDLKVYIKQLFKCFKWKYWVLHIMLSFIKLVLKIELLNQLVHNPQSNIHGYILRFHYVHYQYNTAFKSLLCLGFTFGSAGFVGSTGGGGGPPSRGNTAIITCALRCKRHLLRKARRTFKNQK